MRILQDIVSNKIKQTQESQLERWLRWFDKNGEQLKGEFPLKNVDFISLKKVFQPESDDPFMYYCYPVSTSEQVQLIQRLVNFELNFDQYEYFVECNSFE